MVNRQNIIEGNEDIEDLDVETEEWRLESMVWCTCTECIVMSTTRECLCCRELDICIHKMNLAGVNEDNACITAHPKFEMVVLEEEILRTALVARFDIRADSFTEPLENK